MQRHKKKVILTAYHSFPFREKNPLSLDKIFIPSFGMKKS